MPSVTHDLHVFMAQVSSEMASEYARIYAKAAADPGTAGDEGEENWAALLRDWLPANYHVQTKGRLIAADGAMSAQVDVVVLKPAYPKKLLEKKIWLADGVAAVFECKTTITAAHISGLFARCYDVKRLFKQRTGSPRLELRSPILFGLLAHSHSWKADNSKPLENINRAIESSTEAVSHPRFLPDLLCVADLGFWSSMYLPRYDSSWLSGDKAALTRKIFEGPWGVTTSFICAAYDTRDQGAQFQPMGGLLGYLTQRLAWDDSTIRDIADYYRLANLWGSGLGSKIALWPPSVYSDEVKAGIEKGRLVNASFWNDWTLAGI